MSGPIHVLLVDDNEQWRTFMSEELEYQNPDVEVTVVESATEALLTIRDNKEIDCVVTDYRMPEIDGIELLERVHEEFKTLPFILTTGDGSEQVASKAISSGIADYFKKDPRTDQPTLLEEKIRAAVSQHRLRQAIAESEAQYRTVMEQIDEAIFVVRGEYIVYYNRSAEDLLGGALEAEADSDTKIDWDWVHPDDVETCQTLMRRWQNGIVDDALHSVRVYKPDGTIRHCELTGSTIPHENNAEIMLTVRDVTERIQREKALERQRELHRTVQQHLMAERTREGFEREIVNELHADGYPLVWIGDIEDGVVRPKASAGETSYLDDVSFETDAAAAGEPVVWAVQRGEPQFVMGFGDLFETEWCVSAIEHGLQAGAGLPLRDGDVTWGVLGVYAETLDAFNESERQLLTELADSLALAIHDFERDQALTSDRIVEVRLRIDGDEYYLTDSVSGPGIESGDKVVELTIQGTITTEGNRTIQYVMLNGVDFEAFEEAMETNEYVEEITPITEEPNCCVQVITTAELPETTLAELGAIVRSAAVTPTETQLRVELSAKQDIRTLLKRLQERFESATVETVQPKERTGTDVVPRYMNMEALTNKQAIALQTATLAGFFDRPQRATATEVAAVLEISRSTFLHHLRTAEQKLFTNAFGDSGDTPPLSEQSTETHTSPE